MAENELVDAVARIARVFARRNVRHALIGGLAVGLRSRPRATKDAHFIVSLPAVSLPELLEDLLHEGFEIDVVDNIRRWSIDRLIAFRRGRVQVDWMQPVIPLYAHVLDQAKPEQWLDAELRVASPEGLILTKMVSFRPQDQVDIQTLLIANREEIDPDFIRNEWSAVAEGEETRTTWLENELARLVPER